MNVVGLELSNKVLLTLAHLRLRDGGSFDIKQVEL